MPIVGILKGYTHIILHTQIFTPYTYTELGYSFGELLFVPSPQLSDYLTTDLAYTLLVQYSINRNSRLPMIHPQLQIQR